MSHQHKFPAVMVVIVLILFALSSIFFLSASNVANTKQEDPCDGYGNCLGTAISYVRANPDGTLYVGDAFTIIPSITRGPNTTSVSTSWIYDTSELSQSGDTFTVTGNYSGSFTVTLVASFTVVLHVGNTTTTVYSVLYSSQAVVVKPLQINILRLYIVNDTDKYGNVLRNPDGSFYRNDTFCVRWNATFLFVNVRKDIKINVTASSPSLIRVNSTYDPLGRWGTYCFRVKLSAPYQPSQMVFNFYAVNPLGVSIAHRVVIVPFAVVKYDPHFTYFAYMLYNSRNSSSYYREFVLLVRYDYNSPGYSYQGDINTAQITNPKDTRERAWINNFTFATVGYNVTVKVPNTPGYFGNASQAILFTNSTVKAAYKYMNSSYPVVRFGETVKKYYFYGNVGKFGMEYYNTTISAWSENFGGYKRWSDFNTTYLYEPVKFSGYLTFRFYDPLGYPDSTASVDIVSINPSPINNYLISRVKSKFGDDPLALRAFEKDLYPSNYTLTLKPLSGNTNGSITFLLNETNIDFGTETMLPLYNITIHSLWGYVTFSFNPDGPPYLTNEQVATCAQDGWLRGLHGAKCYNFNFFLLDYWGLYLVNRSVISSLPFSNITAYYFLAGTLEAVLPLNSTAVGHYTGIYLFSPKGPVIDPFLLYDTEPGHITLQYTLLHGFNNTLYVRMGGGGIDLFSYKKSQDGSHYTFYFDIKPESGGVTSVSVTTDRGTTLLNTTLSYPKPDSFPRGYVGPYQLQTSIGDAQNEIKITFTNPMGAKTIIIVPVTPVQQEISFPWDVLTVIILALIAIYMIGLAVRKRFGPFNWELGEESPSS